MVCEICKSKKRKIKFSTERVKICQWCISLLCEKPVDPDVLLSRFNIKISNYVQLNYIDSKIDNITSLAKKQLGLVTEPNFFDRMFNSKKVNKRDEVVLLKVNEIIQEIKIEKRKEIEALILSGEEDRPKEISYCNYQTGAIGYKDIVKRKHVKYLNAISKKLTSSGLKETRPDENEWKNLRESVLKEDGYRCNICGIYPKEKHVHHIIPLSKFGSNESANLVTLCYKCHDKQHIGFKVTQHIT